MSYEPKDLTFSLFKNDKKTTDKHPDYTGAAMVGGVAYFADAWINETSSGVKYMSGKLKKKENQKGAPKSPAGGGSRAAPTFADEGSDIPF